MQPASSGATSVLKDDDGRIYGVVLGADFTAEHEWGVKRLKRDFGIPGGRIRFAEMVSTRIPEHQHFDAVHVETDHSARKAVKTDTRSACVWTDSCDGETVRRLARRFSSDQEIAGAWDEGAFAIRGYGNEGIAVVDLIREGIEARDISLWIGGGAGNPFARGGLVIVRHSLVPQNMSAQFDEATDDAIRLATASEATGIAKRVQEGIPARYGSPYFALSPSWTPEARKRQTAHPVIYWLNPTDQQNVNHGWFTVEELDQWIAGTGPIPKTAKQKKEERR